MKHEYRHLSYNRIVVKLRYPATCCPWELAINPATLARGTANRRSLLRAGCFNWNYSTKRNNFDIVDRFSAIRVAFLFTAYRCLQGDWETLSATRPTSGYTQHTLTNTGALTVSVDRDKGGNGIPRKVLKCGRKIRTQKKRKKLTQGGGGED
jgi:hypothetical protein